MPKLTHILVAILLGASLSTPEDAFPAGPLIDCEALPGLVPNVWEGLGVDPDGDNDWDNDANWSLGLAPIRLSDPYVCIPANWSTAGTRCHGLCPRRGTGQPPE